MPQSQSMWAEFIDDLSAPPSDGTYRILDERCCALPSRLYPDQNSSYSILYLTRSDKENYVWLLNSKDVTRFVAALSKVNNKFSLGRTLTGITFTVHDAVTDADDFSIVAATLPY